MHRAAFYPSIGEMSSAMEYGRICAAVLSEEEDAKLAKILTTVQQGSQQAAKYRQIAEMPIVKGDVAQQEKFFELFEDGTEYEQYVIVLHEQGSNYLYAKRPVSGAGDVLAACRKLRDVDLAYGESKEDKEKRLAKEKENADKQETGEQAQVPQTEQSTKNVMKLSFPVVYGATIATIAVVTILVLLFSGEKEEKPSETKENTKKTQKKQKSKGKKSHK